MTGIEPALSAWEAEVLPLNYTREPSLLGHSQSTSLVMCCFQMAMSDKNSNQAVWALTRWISRWFNPRASTFV